MAVLGEVVMLAVVVMVVMMVVIGLVGGLLAAAAVAVVSTSAVAMAMAAVSWLHLLPDERIESVTSNSTIELSSVADSTPSPCHGIVW